MEELLQTAVGYLRLVVEAIGATILNLVLNPTWAAVATTALTILVRKLITFSLRLDYSR